MTKGMRWPAVTVKTASCMKLWPSSGTGPLSHTESGPATATTSLSTRWIHGTTLP